MGIFVFHPATGEEIVLPDQSGDNLLVGIAFFAFVINDTRPFKARSIGGVISGIINRERDR